MWSVPGARRRRNRCRSGEGHTPALTPPLCNPGSNPGCIEHQSDGMSRKGDMWYNATASALTPPLQSIPRRCQRRGDRLLPEPNLSDTGLHYRQDDDCSASATAPCRRPNATPDAQPGCNMLLRQFVQHCKEASLRITTLWRCRVDSVDTCIVPARSTPLLVSIGGICREYTIEDRVWQYVFET